MGGRVTARIVFLIAGATLLLGCGASQEFVAVPAGLDRSAVPHRTIEMQAKRYEFVPDTVRVKAGTLVTLRITALDGTHGFALGAFGIDERLDENQTRVVEFYASKPGEYGFRCSHFCGLGHLGMKGRVIVEPGPVRPGP